MTSPVLETSIARIRRSEHTFMLFVAVVIGCVGGLGAVGFRLFIGWLQDVLWGGTYSMESLRSLSPWWKLAVPTIGGLVVGPLVYFFAREAKGHGVPEVMEAVALRSGVIRPRVVAVKTAASAISIASGGSVGREGPIVQIGSALGSAVGQLLRVSGRRLRTLVGCGAAAGIAATFNAPIAGALFSVEIILGDFGVSRFSPIVISSVMATVISRHFLGDVPAFIVPQYSLGSSWELLIYLVLGVACAGVALTFVKTLYATEDIFERLPIKPWIVTPIGGLIIGAIGINYPEIFGVGYEAIEDALDGNLLVSSLLILLVLKVVATSITIGAGFSGGVFAPSLFLGAMTGGVVGHIAHGYFPSISTSPGAYALVGMGAVVAGATHAPITAILIIFELTHDYKLILPLMGTCIIATLFTTRIMAESIYTKKLVRRGVDVFGGREVNVLRALRVGDVMRTTFESVAPDERFATVVERATTSPGMSLYVVDEKKRLHGSIGYPEIRDGLADADSINLIVVAADVSNTHVNPVTADTDLDTLTRIFGNANAEELPVIDTVDERHMVGVVTRGHVIEAYNREVMKRDMVAGIAGGLGAATSGDVALGDDHHLAELDAPGTFVGRTMAQLDVRRRYGVHVVLIRRRTHAGSQHRHDLVPGPEIAVELDDKLVVMGRRADIDQLRAS